MGNCFSTTRRERERLLKESIRQKLEQRITQYYRAKHTQDTIEVTLSDDEFNGFYNGSITFIKKEFHGNSYRVTLSVVDSVVIRVKLSNPLASASGVLSNAESSIGGGLVGAAGGAMVGAAVGGPAGSILGAGVGASLGAYTASKLGKDGTSYELRANKENVVHCPVRECFSLMDENAKTNKGRIRVTLAGELQITPD